jgi:hypothetical protein
LLSLLVGSNSDSLKLLHTLLEPTYPATGLTISFIGLSNWHLDISKSSRAILVQRYFVKGIFYFIQILSNFTNLLIIIIL